MTTLVTMRVTRDPDPEEFMQLSEAYRMNDRCWTNPLATAAAARVSGRVPRSPETMWLRIVDDAVESEYVVGLACCAQPLGVVLSDMSTTAAALLADYLSIEQPGIPSFNGPIAPSTVCAKRYAERASRALVAGLDQRLLAASTISPPIAVPGRQRPAEPDDDQMLMSWIDAFNVEALPGDPRRPTSSLRERILGPTGLWLWENDGEAVSLCWQSPIVSGVVRIAVVYTPSQFRGRGYASANVAAVSRRALSSGADVAMLYTDRTNPTSNRVYEHIGFRYVGDAFEWFVR